MGMGEGDRQLTFGMVGLGYWGPNLLRVLTEMPGVEIKWICDLDPQRLERFGRRYPSCARTSDADLLFEDPELDAMIIATPVFTHFDLASRALSAGKHTFVEKPLASSASMADQLLDLSEEKELTLMCGHTFVYSPPVRAIKRRIDDGEIGDVFFISSNRVNLGLHQPDVSVIWDLGPTRFLDPPLLARRDAADGAGRGAGLDRPRHPGCRFREPGL